MEHCKISNSKHQTGAPPRGWGLRRRNIRILGVRFQVSGKQKKLKPVGAKQQRETLKPQSL
jgi:hypothetical protein